MEKYVTAGQASDDSMALRVVCWVTEGTDTHSYYLMLIAFPRQRWLCERSAVLPFTAIACLVPPPRPLDVEMYCYKACYPTDVTFPTMWNFISFLFKIHGY